MCHALIGDQICSFKSPQIPDKLLMYIILHVGHRVGDCTPMQRFPPFTTDFGPHFGQHQAGSITVIFRRRLHWLSKVAFEKGQVGGQSGSVGEVNRIVLDGDIDHPLRFSQHVSQTVTYIGQRRNQGPFVRVAA